MELPRATATGDAAPLKQKTAELRDHLDPVRLGRLEPDQAARAYLKVIARHPDLVAETLAADGNASA